MRQDLVDCAGNRRLGQIVVGIPFWQTFLYSDGLQGQMDESGACDRVRSCLPLGRPLLTRGSLSEWNALMILK